MDCLACPEVCQHRPAGGNGGIAELGFRGHAPSTQQAAHDDAAIEEVRECRRGRQLEWERAKLCVPCHARKKARRAQCRVKICGVAGALMQKEKSADGVAGDFGGDARVLAEIGAVVSCNAAARFLNSRVQEPAAGRFDRGIGR